MINCISKKVISEMAKNILCLLLAVFLFIFSQPNQFYLTGINFFAWLMLIPILFIVFNCSTLGSFIYGFIYGISVYVLYALWLLNYNKIALFLVAIYEGVLYAIVFVLLKISFELFEDFCFIMQCLIWCTFEYLRTIGFFGVNYGVIGYSQWNNPILLQSASLFGVHGLNFILVFPACFIFSLLIYQGKKIQYIKKHGFYVIGYIIILAALIVYGVIILNKPVKTDTEKTICLVQNNIDTSKYYHDKNNEILDSYKKLIFDAMQKNHNIDLIVLPEGAVRPRVLLNEEDSIPLEMYEDVVEYLQFFHDIDIPLVFGSVSLEYDGIRNGIFTYKAYNIACYLENKIKTIPALIDVYKKRHLVPIFEKMPFVDYYNKKVFKYSRSLSPGKEIVVFPLNDISFCTPICFEESFGYDVRRFMKKNPSFILSISSDLWSKSIVCQYQHLAMEVFRAVENRLPLLRASVSGQTVYIDNKGICKQMLNPFVSDFLICNVSLEIKPKKTVYTKIGDLLGISYFLICIICFMYKYIKNLTKKETI